MTQFAPGNKVKVIQERTSSTSYGRLTEGSIHTVKSLGRTGNVELVGDEHAGFSYHDYRFALVDETNGVDAFGVPKNMTADDLLPYQRVKVKNGEIAIVCVDSHGLKGLVYPGNSRPSIRFDSAFGSYHVVEVYNAPRHAQALNFKELGSLVWTSNDAAKVEAKRKADKAVEEAKAALATAEAARAAL